jgi:hypothetical protein
VAADELAFLTGKTVEQIWVWGTVRLVIESGNRPEPEVYVDFTDALLVSANGQTNALNVDRGPRETGTVLSLLHDRIESAQATAGTLHISFASGAELRASPSEQYESWCVVGNGRVSQCLPGGELGVW